MFKYKKLEKQIEELNEKINYYEKMIKGISDIKIKQLEAQLEYYNISEICEKMKNIKCKERLSIETQIGLSSHSYIIYFIDEDINKIKLDKVFNKVEKFFIKNIDKNKKLIGIKLNNNNNKYYIIEDKTVIQLDNINDITDVQKWEDYKGE